VVGKRRGRLERDRIPAQEMEPESAFLKRRFSRVDKRVDAQEKLDRTSSGPLKTSFGGGGNTAREASTFLWGRQCTNSFRKREKLSGSLWSAAICRNAVIWLKR